MGKMAHASKVEGILTGLDELLDTRLGTVGLLSPEAARKLLSTDAYHTRETDEFEGVNAVEYKIAYAERTVRNLRNSVMTPVVFHLRQVVKQLLWQAVSGPDHDAVRLTVNVYPYSDFSDEEKSELSRVLKYHMNGGVDIKAHEQPLLSVDFIDVAPEKLTPSHCKASYGAMYMYNPWAWLNLHTEALKAGPRLPEVIIYAPRLYHDGKPDAKELSRFQMDFDGKAPDPLTFDEMRVSPIAGVTLLDVSQFSSSVRLQRNQATT